MERRTISTSTPWENRVGYSRAVRVGPFVHVSGTLPADETGAVLGGPDPEMQTLAALDKIERALAACGARLEDVVRTRMYVTDLDLADRIGAAHRARFGTIRPCATMVEVVRLAAPDAFVEIEVDAIVADDAG